MEESTLKTISSQTTASRGFRTIEKAEMEALVKSNEEEEDPNIIIVDVRTPDEITSSGPISQRAIQMQLPTGFQHENEVFESQFNHPKPVINESQTLVFSCHAGVRFFNDFILLIISS